jgi:transcriptional regulator with XRE-family HTH domain
MATVDLTPLAINIAKARHRAGLSQHQAANLCGRSGGWLGKIEAGERGVGPWANLVLLSRVLNVSMATLCEGTGITEKDFEGVQPVSAVSGLEVPWTTTGAVSALLAITEDEDQMNRRGFLAASGIVIATATHQALDAPAVADVGRLGGGTQVTDAMIDTIVRAISALRDLDNQLGGPRVSYRDPLRAVRDLIRNGTYTDRIGRRLYSVAAELLRLCGWVSYDSNDVPGAQRYWLAGLRQAKVSGDTAMGAHTMASLASLTLKNDDPRSAVAQAQNALAHYSGQSPKVKARLHLQLAKCYAATHDANRCLRELAAAEDLVSRFNEPAPDWASWIDGGVVANDAGLCYADLQDTRRGIEHLQRGLRLHQGFPRDEALFNAHLAITAASGRQPDLDLVVTAATASMDLLESVVVSPRCVGEVRDAASRVSSWSQRPAVRQMIERARALPRSA